MRISNVPELPRLTPKCTPLGTPRTSAALWPLMCHASTPPASVMRIRSPAL